MNWNLPTRNDRLREVYVEGNPQDLEREFGVGWKTIRRHACKIGLRRQGACKPAFWKLQENVSSLKKLYPTASQASLLTRFPGRSWKNIRQAAAELKIKRSFCASRTEMGSHNPLFKELRRRRVKLHLKIRDVAHAAGVSPSTIVAAELGHTVPSVINLQAWAGALGMNFVLKVVGPPIAKHGMTPPEKKRNGKRLPKVVEALTQQAAIDMAAWKKAREADRTTKSA